MGLVYRAFREHPLVVVAAPVYFAGLPGQLKNLIDRFQCAWVAKYRLKRPWFPRESGRRGYLLSVSALHRPDFYDHSRAPLQALLLTLNYADAGGTYFPGHDEEDAVRADERALELSRQAGESFARESIPGQA
jgi:multimeric flavodoxin WrbA